MNILAHFLSIQALSVSIDSIISYLSLGLTIAFFVVIALLVIAFLRGLTQGWRYGTYRFLFFAVLITVCFLILSPLTKALGEWDLSSAVGQVDIQFSLSTSNGDVLISSSLTSLHVTVADIIAQVLKAYEVSMDPASLSACAAGLADSLIVLLLIAIEAILLFIIGQLLCLIFWHLIFKHFHKREKRKKKTLRLVSGFQELILGAVILSMLLLPFTSLANALSGAFHSSDEETSEKAGSQEVTPEVYNQVKAVVDTYDNSLFSKVFFNWTRDQESGATFDTSLMEFLTNIQIDGEKSISFVKELRSLSSSAVYAIKGGLLEEGGAITKASSLAFLSSSYAPKLISSLTNSDLILGVLPFALNVATNLPEIRSYLETETQIDFSSYDYGSTLNEIADLYKGVQESGIISECFDEEGNLVVTKNAESISELFLNKYEVFQNIIRSFDKDEMKLFSELGKSALWVEIVREYEEAANRGTSILDSSSIGVADFFPSFSLDELRNEEGKVKAVPEAILSFNFEKDLLPLMDRTVDIFKVDDTLLPLVLRASLSEEGFSSDVLGEFLAIAFKDQNIDKMEYLLDGKAYEGVEEDENFTPMLGLKNLQYVFPKLLKMAASSLNSVKALAGETPYSADELIADYLDETKTPNRSAYILQETRSLFSIVRPLFDSEAGQTLLRDYLKENRLSGLYFSPADGSFLGVDDALLEPLTESLRNIDTSRFLSYFLPSVLQNTINGNIGSLNSSLGLIGENAIRFEFKDKKNLGSGIADLVSAYMKSQDLVSFLLRQGISINGVHDAENLLKGLLSFKVAGRSETQFGALLSAFLSNPLIDDTNHTNLSKILGSSLAKAGFGDHTETLKEIFSDPSFDTAENVNGLVDFLSVVRDQNALTAFLSINEKDFSALRNVSFEILFSKIDEIPLVSHLLGPMLDRAFAKFKDYISYGDGKTLSFANVESWGDEGKALDALVSFAVEIGDFSNINIFSGDPDSVESLIKTLSTSKIFYADGKYILPEFLSDKLVDVFLDHPDIGFYFVNYGAEEADKAMNYTDFSKLLLSLDEEGIANEAAAIGETLRAVQNNGGSIDIFDIQDASNFDFRKLNPLYVEDAIEAMGRSVLFGRIPLAHTYLAASKALAKSDSRLSSFLDANTYYLYDPARTSEERIAEVSRLTELLRVFLDPAYGLVDQNTGKLDASALNDINAISPRYLLEPALNALAGSGVFNTSKYPLSEDPLAMKTTFKELLASIIGDLGFFVADPAHSEKEVARYAVYNVADWQEEIDALVSVFEDVKGLDLDFTNLNFDSLFENEALRENSRLKLEELLNDAERSSLLRMGLPAKLESAIESFSESFSGLGNALSYVNYYSEGTILGYPTLAKARYSEAEMRHLSYFVRDAYALKTDLSGLQLDIDTLSEKALDSAESLLTHMAQSVILNTPKEGTTYTAFKEAVVNILNPAEGTNGYFVGDHSHSAQDVARHSIYGGINWDEEIKSIVDAVRNAKKAGLTISKGLDFGSLFEEGKDAENGESLLSSFLLSLDHSKILSSGFPEKFDEGLLKAGNVLKDTPIDFSLANPYFVGRESGYPTLAKSSYGEAEINTLSSLIKEVYSIGSSFEVSAMGEKQIDSLTEALGLMGKSYVFNSVRSGEDHSLFAESFGALFETDALKNYLYLDYSPKDIHFGSEYSSLRSKAYYLAKSEVGTLVYPTLTPSSIDVSSISGMSNSLRSTLQHLRSLGVFSNFVGNDLASLDETVLKGALLTLGENPYTRDLVPNLLAATIKKGSFNMEGITLERANPFYIYSLPEGYDASFPEGEIEALTNILHTLQEKGVKDLSSTSTLTSAESIRALRNLLGILSESETFHLSGAGYDLLKDNNPSLKDESDLDVFSQIIYKIYKDSTLASFAYDEVYDGTYENAEAKLLANIQKVPADLWEKELNNLFTNLNGEGGFLLDALHSGLFEGMDGSNFSPDTLSLMKLKPETMELLGNDINGLMVGRDALGYLIQDLFEDGINIASFTSLTFTYQNEDIASLLSSIRLPIEKIAFDASSTVSYKVAGADKTLSGTELSFVEKGKSLPLGTNLVYEGKAISVTVTYCVYDLFQDEASYRNGVIPSVRSFLEAILQNQEEDGSYSYISFDSNDKLAEFLGGGEESGAFLKFLRFFKFDEGLFKTPFDETMHPNKTGSFPLEASDVVLGNIFNLRLAVNLNGQSFENNLELLTYMPNYTEDATKIAYPLGDLNRLFYKGTDNYLSSSSWLMSHFKEVTTYDLIRSSAKDYTVSYKGMSLTFPRLHSLFIAYANADLTLKPLATYLVATGENPDSFEYLFKAGLSYRFYEEIRSYLLAQDYFYGLALNKPVSTLNSSVRLSNLPSAMNAITSANSKTFLTLSSKLFGAATSLALDLSKARSGASLLSWPLDAKTKAKVSEDLASFASFTLDSEFSDFVITVYQGLLYELFVNRDYFHAANPLTHEAEVDWITTPFGTDGYFQNAASSILVA